MISNTYVFNKTNDRVCNIQNEAFTDQHVAYFHTQCLCLSRGIQSGNFCSTGGELGESEPKRRSGKYRAVVLPFFDIDNGSLH